MDKKNYHFDYSRCYLAAKFFFAPNGVGIRRVGFGLIRLNLGCEVRGSRCGIETIQKKKKNCQHKTFEIMLDYNKQSIQY